MQNVQSNMLKKCSKYAENMLEICRIICKICRICTKICIKICEKYAKKICEKYAEHALK